MSVFFCIHGDVSNIAIGKANSFSVKDSNGDNWICTEQEGDSIDVESMMQAKQEVMTALDACHKQGFCEEGSRFVAATCEREVLPARLAETPKPRNQQESRFHCYVAPTDFVGSPSSFSVVDTKHRRWICCEAETKPKGMDDVFYETAELSTAAYAAAEQGKFDECRYGTVTCGRAALSTKLGNS